MIALLCLLVAAPQLDASVSVGSTLRRLNFRDRLSPTLAGWDSGLMAVGGLSLQAYAGTGKLPVLDDIGAYLDYKRSLQSTTQTADGILNFNTQETAWDAGLRWRYVRDGIERGGVSFGYGSLRYVFAGASLPGFLLPAGMVQYWRPGLDARFAAGRVALRAGAAYLLIVRQDFLSAFFPRASKGGVEGMLSATTDVWLVKLTLAARYQRYFYSLHPLQYDPYVAGGALDEVFDLDLSCGLRF
ncbi:MAG TPA: hypothetical protein VLW85_18460 [Myxococcales bacterium]|nr:hypothetical protein [Myxococcales bacterium]